MNDVKIDFEKNSDELIPVIVQDAATGVVLMLGYMNEAAYEKTRAEGLVTFFSRSRNALWTKGETSGYYLKVKNILKDCDADTLLIKADPQGPVCHTGQDTCFDEKNSPGFITQLENIIAGRKQSAPDNSYTGMLFRKGTAAIAQKVGEEAVELVIEAMRNDDEKFKEEAADLFFHYLVLLQSRGFALEDIAGVLSKRNRKE